MKWLSRLAQRLELDAMQARFFLKPDGGAWQEVTEDAWIIRERACGFTPKYGGEGRATASFSAYGWTGIYTTPSTHADFREFYPDLPA
jgi:hypothetical protein